MQYTPQPEKYQMTLQPIEKQAELDERSRCRAIMEAGMNAGRTNSALELMQADITEAEAVQVLKAMSGEGNFKRALRDANSSHFDEVAWQRNMKTALARINKTI